MGRDKALLPGPDGRPFVALALDALRACGAAHLRISANDPAPFAALDVPVVPDEDPGQGPLAGLVALLREAPTEWLLLVACDMPSLNPAVLTRVLEARVPDHHAVVPRVGDQLQPLHAAWHRSALPALERAMAEGRRSLVALVSELRAFELPMEEDPSFRNVNTPDDLEPR